MAMSRPLLHALVDPGVAHGFGVEIDPIKCQKAMPFIKGTLRLLADAGAIGSDCATPRIACAAIEEVSRSVVAFGCEFESPKAALKRKRLAPRKCVCFLNGGYLYCCKCFAGLLLLQC